VGRGSQMTRRRRAVVRWLRPSASEGRGPRLWEGRQRSEDFALFPSSGPLLPTFGKRQPNDTTATCNCSLASSFRFGRKGPTLVGR
jgi:hypothetical protein